MLIADVSTLTLMREEFGDRLTRLREAAGLSRQQLADAVGVSRSAIALLENGQSKSMESENLLKAAEALGVHPNDLQFGDEKRVSEPTVRFARAPGAFVRNIPVIGFAIANPVEDGFFDDMGFPPGGGDAYLPWRTKDPNAYALRVRGDSMQPRIRPGQLVVIEPGAAVHNLDDVVVCLKNGRKMVKQLLNRRAGEVTLGSINQAHQQTTVALEEVESIQFVAAIVSRNNAEEGA